ncbi:MAG: VCBS repeat-containing protein [Mucilaginibacter polytrichastri]|nr:VCBS repeat-containing protein [Mucilaginibacter polytrichastri]
MSRFCAVSLLFLPLLFSACSKKKDALFELQDNASIGINFANNLEDQKGTNIFSYRNFYNGGGVAIGDLNNDGLNDIFLTSNQGDNQLYINKGNWKFDNVSDKAGIKGTKYWSTGVSLVDINADGWLDIYVCNSGNAQGTEAANELFINQKDGTFKEEAVKYGLADEGLTTHAVFFDYDLDGDLDCYILNNSFRPIESFDFSQNLREKVDLIGGDRLYRNDNGHFTNVTEQAGIHSSDIGFGLGVSVVDIDQDGYPDIYVSNDFFERDYLYINQKNGTFRENIQNETGHLSLASMGSDIGDINNDGQYDIFTTEMLPESDKRLKLVTSFESYDVIKLKQRDGYYNQYMQNCLQVNNGDGTFSETAFYSGVAATDWSWGALFFDMDNDGWKDIFVSNGIYKDLTNQDYIEFLGNRDNMEKIAQGKKFDFKEFTDKMTSTPISNYAFLNNRNLTFSNKAEDFGLATPSYSNGSAYGDLDNDGDLDLVVNNVNMPVFVYRNTAETKKQHSVSIQLKGDGQNTFAVGSTIKAFVKGEPMIFYQQPARGFQSSVPPGKAVIGLGANTQIDSLLLIWPDGRFEKVTGLRADSSYAYSISNAKGTYTWPVHDLAKPLLRPVTASLFDSIPRHTEDEFIDFDQEKLMLQMLSTENPYLAKADVNGDGLPDFFMGASKGHAAAIYVQQANGRFRKANVPDFEKQNYLETAGAAFADYDGDGDQDLIVAVGGNADEAGTSIYYPRYFENDGKGHFTLKRENQIRTPVNASVVAACDFDKDGYPDLFIGGRSTPGVYGSAPKSYLLKNDGKGHFTDISKAVFTPENPGMVTAAKWVDLDGNGYDDLVIAGNWMGILIFRNEHGKLVRDTALEKYQGWWNSLEVADVNGDGYPDIIAGNLGLNSRLKASEKQPLRNYIKDFDQNGTQECVTSLYKSDGEAYVFNMRQDLVGQMPSFKKRFLRYESYAGKPFSEVFPEDLLKGAEEHSINTLQTTVFFSEKGRSFRAQPLPYPAQLAPVNTIVCDDLDGDGKKELILAGNFWGFKPELGRQDASYGQVFRYTNGKFSFVPSWNSGLQMKGQVRSSLSMNDAKGAKFYLFGLNDAPLQAYKPAKP